MARALGLPLVLAVAVLHAVITFSVSASYVRGPEPSIALDSSSNNNGNDYDDDQTQRIAELEQQLAELRRSLEICSAAADNNNNNNNSSVQQETGKVQRSAQQQYEIMPPSASSSSLSNGTQGQGSRKKPAGTTTSTTTVVSRRVEDLVVNREITSYNWGNSSALRRRLNDDDDELDKKPVIGICLASTSKSKRNRGSGFDAIPLFKVLLPSLVRRVGCSLCNRECGHATGITPLHNHPMTSFSLC